MRTTIYMIFFVGQSFNVFQHILWLRTNRKVSLSCILLEISIQITGSLKSLTCQPAACEMGLWQQEQQTSSDQQDNQQEWTLLAPGKYILRKIWRSFWKKLVRLCLYLKYWFAYLFITRLFLTLLRCPCINCQNAKGSQTSNGDWAERAGLYLHSKDSSLH